MSVYVETNPKKSMYIRTKSPWQNFESLMLQYPYKDFQRKIIKKLVQKKKVDLTNYTTKTKDYPRVILEQKLDELSYQNTRFLKNSFELWEWTQKVTDFIKPILFYYSWQQFSAFFIYTLFKWPSPSRGHGVACTFGESGEIEEIKIEFRKMGFFRRLVDTFVVLGNPTAYGSWIPLGAKQGLIFKENRIDSGISIDKMKLVNILDFDPQKFYSKFKSMYPNKYYGPHVDVLLTDFLLIFIASNIARYRPQLWNNVLDGKGKIEAEFNLRAKKAYRNYAGSHNCLLDQVWSEFLKWKE